MSVWEEARAELHTGTDHDYQVVRRVIADGRTQLWEQCSVCGHAPRAVKAADPRVMRAVELPSFDEELRRQFEQSVSDVAFRRLSEQSTAEQRQRIIEADQAKALWLAKYNDYLQSRDWQARRLLVLERDGRLCQGCRRQPANEVHHKTYDHGFDAPLFDLVALCHPCHERITAMDRARRGAA